MISLAGIVASSMVRAGEFTPASISGLQLWLDAADAGTITVSGNSVSQWNDKSGNGRHVLQTTSSWQPSSGTRTVNSRNAVDFDGTNDFLSRGDAFGFSGNPTVTCVMAWDVDQVQAAYGMLQLGEGTGGGDYRRIIGYATDNSFRYDGGNQVFDGTATGVGIFLFERQQGDTFGDGRFWKDGVERSQTGGGGTNTTDLRAVVGYVGKARYVNPNLNYFTDGAACEILLYDKVLSTTEKNNLGNHLALKWGGSWTTI